MKTLTELRQKWKPVLMCKSVIPESDIKEYDTDVKNYKANNPNWKNINLLHI